MSTPSQTVGPFFTIGLTRYQDPGGTVRLSGRVLDGAGEPVPDALVETWQSDPAVFARCPTDAAGRWDVRVADTPYVTISVFARGLLNRVVTRAYLNADATDPVLGSIEPGRRATLVAAQTDDGYTFDVHLQGPHETVFFSF
jgi:protocatechuate 3,4-dioxygenase alpha subunit